MSDDRLQASSEVRGFVHAWFDLLSEHVPVELLLPFLADQGLEMAFPERTLRDHTDFRDWYTAVGLAYARQTHDVERITAREDADGVDLALTVVWRAEQTDGPPVAVRVDQDWRLVRLPEGSLRIAGYQVGEMHDVEPEAVKQTTESSVGTSGS